MFVFFTLFVALRIVRDVRLSKATFAQVANVRELLPVRGLVSKQRVSNRPLTISQRHLLCFLYYLIYLIVQERFGIVYYKCETYNKSYTY